MVSLMAGQGIAPLLAVDSTVNQYMTIGQPLKPNKQVLSVLKSWMIERLAANPIEN